ETNVMAHQLEASIRQQMMHVASGPGVEIINAQNFVAAFQQAIAKVRSNKSGSAGDEDTTFCQHGHQSRGEKAFKMVRALSAAAITARAPHWSRNHYKRSSARPATASSLSSPRLRAAKRRGVFAAFRLVLRRHT